MILELIERWRFWRDADRIGPDAPATHWRLYLRSTMTALCRRKFARFADGADFRPGAYAVACSRISIGRRVVVRPGSVLMADPRENGAGITIEDDVLMGSGVHIYVHDHRFDDPSRPIIDQGHYPSKPVILERGCWIGANAVLLSGTRVGRNSVIGAGAVVKGEIPAGVLAAGNPAKVIRAVDAPRAE